ncbi:MAG: hypothetical protein C5S47_00130 [Candidatus Methanogasteraceae archaeon]|nr:MAG: hypothetical protein C5S47_00130 [ANME-2 cluster archaeon]
MGGGFLATAPAVVFKGTMIHLHNLALPDRSANLPQNDLGRSFRKQKFVAPEPDRTGCDDDKLTPLPLEFGYLLCNALNQYIVKTPALTCKRVRPDLDNDPICSK